MAIAEAQDRDLRPEPRRRRAEDVACAAVFLVCLAYSLLSARIGWSNTILGPHGFRQTQTAISTYYLLQGGPWLAYETPVLGAPWSIPFELPLFQWIVALVVAAVGMPLDQAGRLVSEVFFYATLLPAYALLASLRLRPAHRLLFLALLLVSPQYLYWSRAFMIESTGLFLAASYLALAARALQPWRPRLLFAAILVGAAAAALKVTTFAPFLLAALLLLCRHWWSGEARRFSGGALERFALGGLGLAAVPLASANLWTIYADGLKQQNPLAAGFIDSASLSAWNFGTTVQRFSADPWQIMWTRTLPDVTGNAWLLLAAALLALATRRRVLAFAACAALFASAPLIFVNLHLVHRYYAYANGVFALAAIGLGVAAGLERGGWWRLAGALLLLGALAAPVWRHQTLYLPVQRANETGVIETATYVQSSTAADEVLLVIGLDWNSELPYYARRRALMDRDGSPPDDPRLQRALANLGDRRLGAMAACASARQQRALIESWLRVTGLSPVSRATYACEVFTRAGAGGQGPGAGAE